MQEKLLRYTPTTMQPTSSKGFTSILVPFDIGLCAAATPIVPLRGSKLRVASCREDIVNAAVF
ncbi:MAG: hypothetical protein V7K23_32360 [Nostoc sp.]